MFRRCYTPGPWTPSAHASLFTGLLPRRHGCRENGTPRLPPEFPTLAESLRDAGYDTVGVFGNPFLSPVTGLSRGFRDVAPYFDLAEGKAPASDAVARVREALDRRGDGGGRPLFLCVNLMDTHLRYTFDGEAVEAFHGKEAVAPAFQAARSVGRMDALAHMTAVRRLPAELVDPLDDAYDGSVHAQDRATGAILDLLRERGILERALVVVAGDHGENLGEDGDLEHAFSVADTLLRVPLVVRWPGRIPAGAVEDALVRLQDLYPTILEAAGVPVPEGNGVDAEPLLPLPAAPRVAVAEWGPGSDILDRLRRENPGARIPGEDRCREALLAVVDPSGWKYVRTTFTGEDGKVSVREALHALREDPGEDRNLLGGTPTPVHRSVADALRDHGLADVPPARR